MAINKFFVLPQNKSRHPFLTLCLSMVAVGIAAELISVTSRRYSVVGDSILQMIPLGILLCGLLGRFFKRFYRICRDYVPIIMLVFSIGMLGVNQTRYPVLISALFGIVIGIFISMSLVGFLESGDSKNLGIKLGISASLYSVSAYPFRLGYQFSMEIFPKIPIDTVGFAILIVLIVCVSFLWSKSTSDNEIPEQVKAGPFALREEIILLTGLTILICLGQIINSGTLEKQGTISVMPWLYLVIVVLRIPFGALLGYLLDKQYNPLYLAIPVVVMALGCFFPVLVYKASVAGISRNLAYALKPIKNGKKYCRIVVKVNAYVYSVTRKQYRATFFLNAKPSISLAKTSVSTLYTPIKGSQGFELQYSNTK